MSSFSSLKCIVFDLDNTLWLPRKAWHVNEQQAQSLIPTLKSLKEQSIYLAIASYNLDATSIVKSLYCDVFHVVADCSKETNKVSMFQKIRKSFIEHERRRGFQRKLKWREIGFFDDQEENLIIMQDKGVQVFQVNELTGLTRRQLIRCLGSQSDEL